MADLTGGYGVDTIFMSDVFEHTDYVEQNAELCRIAEHNFSLQKSAISIHNCTAEEFLASAGQYDLIFLDPARRDSHGSKVFRLEDCTPDVVGLLPDLMAHGKRIMLKLSPMLDLTKAVTSLSQTSWDIYVVAVKNEVKELLLLSGGSGRITAIDLAKKEQPFTFTREEECEASSLPFQGELEGAYLYEPNAAILKAGAYKLVAKRFNLHKLDVNTHLYASDKLVEDFPGRTFKALPFREGTGVGSQANVLVRNYPLTPEALKKKLHLRDGGTDFVIGCRVAGKPTLFFAQRVEDIH